MRSRGAAALALVLVLLFVPSAFVYAQTQSTSITIVGIVPEILRLTLDFAQDTTVQLVGHIADTNEQESTYTSENLAHYASYSNQAVENTKHFKIASGSTIVLGNARLFSNIKGSYTMTIYSANRGRLQNSSDTQAASIEYGLILGSAFAMSQNGVFRFSGRGVSTRGGTPLAVALVLGDVPASASEGSYSDQLYFTISKI